MLYEGLAKYYDLIYRNKNYKREAKFAVELSKKYKTGRKLLSIGCGTGNHEKYLKRYFEIVGIDKSKEMLKIAKKKNPEVKYLVGDMRNLKLKEKFDVVIALFNVINYCKNYKELEKLFKNIYKLLNKKSLFIFDTSFINFKPFIEKFEIGKIKIIEIGERVNEKAKIILIFLIKKRREMDIIVDIHDQLIVNVKKLKKILTKIGFDISIKKFNERLFFICYKK